MECSCDIYLDVDGEQCSFIREKIVKARKKHKCSECYRDIERGESYENVFGVWDGDPQTYKTCSDCQKIRKMFFPRGWYYERLWEDVWEYIQEVDGSIPEDCISRLTPMGREKVCSYIEERWKDMEIDELYQKEA